MKVTVEVADAAQLQLLGDAIREAATIRMSAAGMAATDVVADPSITDQRSDGVKLLRILAEANWLRQIADGLPAMVLADAADMRAVIGQSPVYPSVELPAFTGPPPVPDGRGVSRETPPPAAAARAAAVPQMPGAGDVTLRQMTLSPGARLHPGAPIDEEAGPPLIPGAAGVDEVEFETFGMGDEDYV